MNSFCALALTLCLSPLAALAGAADAPSATLSSPAPTSVSLPAPPRCPVTLPNGDAPPSERPSPWYHGNGKIWTSVGDGGRIVFEPEGPGTIEADGSLGIKWPWWWDTPGSLIIHGRRLDAPAPPLLAVAPDGRRVDQPLPLSGEVAVSDSTPRGFLGVGLTFPSAGCWEISGTVGDERLTVVILVVLIEKGPTQQSRPSPAAATSGPGRQFYNA